MKFIAFLLAFTMPLALTTGVAQAQMNGRGQPCTVATAADLAAAQLTPVESLGMGPYGCMLVWSRAEGRGINVSVRPLHMAGRDDADIGPGMCAKALASSPEKNVTRQKTRSCKELSGYGTFAVLLTTDPDVNTGRFGTMLLFLNSKDRVTIMASGGVPGGDTPAVQRLGKVLAAKYR